MTTHVVPDPFIDLVLTDPDLLDAEFDAIMAAEFPQRQAPRPGLPHRPDRSSGDAGPGRGSAGEPVAPPPSHLAAPPRAGGRSPPRRRYPLTTHRSDREEAAT